MLQRLQLDGRSLLLHPDYVHCIIIFVISLYCVLRGGGGKVDLLGIAFLLLLEAALPLDHSAEDAETAGPLQICKTRACKNKLTATNMSLYQNVMLMVGKTEDVCSIPQPVVLPASPISPQLFPEDHKNLWNWAGDQTTLCLGNFGGPGIGQKKQIHANSA